MLASAAPPDGAARRGWDFRFKGFVVGAWWGPGATDVEVEAYRDAGFNVVMLGRYMVVDSTGTPAYDERFGKADLLRKQLDLVARHELWAVIDTYTPNDQPWGGVKGAVDGHPNHHAASLTELKWLCAEFAEHPALLGILLGDDKSALNERMSSCTTFLRKNHPDLMPWICQNVPNPSSLAAHGNPIFNPQIYPTLYRRGDTPEQNALSYCKSYAMMRHECSRHGLLMWPMWNAAGVTGDSLIRFPIYAALAYGAQGYWSFCYGGGSYMASNRYRTAEDVGSGKTRMFPVVRKANRRVTTWAPRLLGCTAVGLFADTGAAATVPPGPGRLVEGTDASLLVGILTKDGQPPLAMIVDARVSRAFGGLPRRDVTVTFHDTVRAVTLLSGEDETANSTVAGSTVTVSLDAGEGQLVALGPVADITQLLPIPQRPPTSLYEPASHRSVAEGYIQNVVVSASSAEDMPPCTLVNGHQMIESQDGVLGTKNARFISTGDHDRHWMAFDGPDGVWVQFDLLDAFLVDEIRIWNIKQHRGFGGAQKGMKNVRIEYKPAPEDQWALLERTKIDMADDREPEPVTRVLRGNGSAMRFVRITVEGGVGEGNWFPADSGRKEVGLGQVRFYGQSKKR